MYLFVIGRSDFSANSVSRCFRCHRYGHWAKIVEPLSPRIPIQTAADALIQTVPAILTLPEDKVENTPNESDDVHLIEDIVTI